MLDKREEKRYRDWLYETEKKIVLPAKTIVLLVSFGMLYFLNREFFFSPWCLGFFLFLLLFRPFRIGYKTYRGLFYRHYLKVSFASFIWDALFLIIVICLTGGVRSPLTLVLYAMIIRGAVSYFPSKRLFFSGMATIFLCWMIGLFLIEKNFLFLREPILLPQMAFFWILTLVSTFAMVALAKEREALQKSEKRVRERTRELEKAYQELKKSQDQLVKTEKLATAGRLGAGVGHELRNPLGVIKNAVYYIKSKLPEDPKLAKHIGIMEREIANSNKIISDLLGFSRTTPPIISSQDMNKVVEDTLEVVEIPENIKLVKELGQDLPNAMADPDQIQQAFVNLSLNAIQAMAEGGQLKIITRRRNDFIETEFNDTGCGIPKENIKKLYDPFFTTKARGIGLGLAVTQGIIERHKGNIEVKSEVGKGTTFLVRLPAAKKQVRR